MVYINTLTEDYPLHEGDIRLLYPEMGEEFILPEGFVEVTEGTIPEYSFGKKVQELKPKLINGVYVKQFVVLDMTQEEIERANSDPSILGKTPF